MHRENCKRYLILMQISQLSTLSKYKINFNYVIYIVLFLLYSCGYDKKVCSKIFAVTKFSVNTSLAAKGALPATSHHLQHLKNRKWLPGTPKWPRGLGQLLLNKFFDPSTPSMRKGCDGGKKRGKKERKYG